MGRLRCCLRPAVCCRLPWAAAEPAGSFTRPVTKKKVGFIPTFFILVAGVGFEPHDLQVMSLASYRTALPCDKITLS